LAPLLVGTVHEWSTAMLYGLCLVSLWFWLIVHKGGKLDGIGLSATAVALMLVYLWQGLSMISLPAAVLEAVSPRVADVLQVPWSDGLWGRCFSYAPGATAWEMLKVGGAIAAFWAAHQIGRDDSQGYSLVAYAGFSAAIIALLSIVQTASGTSQVLWLYEPASRIPLGETPGVLFGFRTPFVNVNHAAQFLEMGCLVTFTLAAFGARRGRGILVAAGILCMLGVVATGSNGGRVGLVVGLVFLLTLWLSRSHGRWLRWLVPLAALVIALVGLGVLTKASLSDGQLPRWATADDGELLKGEAWTGTIRMIAAHPVTGVGRGAFRDVYPRYKEQGGPFVHSYVENEYLQVLVELGLPVGGLLLLVVAATWGVALQRWRGQPHVAAALAGVFVLAVHNTVGFGLEFGGVGLPFVILLGVCATQSSGLVKAPRRRTLTLALLVATATSAVFLLPLAWKQGDYSEVVETVRQLPTGDDLAEEAKPYIRWRPASTDLAMALAGAHHSSGNHSESLRWLSRAMYLAPGEAKPHELAAAKLAMLGYKSQALIEIRLALDLQTRNRKQLFSLLGRLTEDYDELDATLGKDPEVRASYAMALLHKDPDSAVARQLIESLSSAAGDDPIIAIAQASGLWADGDRDGAVKALQTSHGTHPQDVPTALALAQYYQKMDDAGAARAVAEETLSHQPGDWRLWLVVAETNAEVGEFGEARRNLDRARDCAGHQTWGQHKIAVQEASLCHQQGDLKGARDAYLISLRYRPQQRSARIKLAEVYAELGQLSSALREYQRIVEQGNSTAYVEKRIQDLEAQLDP